jgi:hypothetical protein
MDREFQDPDAPLQPVDAPRQGPGPATTAPEPCAPAATNPKPDAEALMRRADVLMWDALLGGDGSRLGTSPGSCRPWSNAQRLRVSPRELRDRTDLTAGEPHWNANNFTVTVSDADGRFAAITLVGIRSMSRGELRRRAVELARAGKSSNST